MKKYDIYLKVKAVQMSDNSKSFDVEVSSADGSLTLAAQTKEAAGKMMMAIAEAVTMYGIDEVSCNY